MADDQHVGHQSFTICVKCFVSKSSGKVYVLLLQRQFVALPASQTPARIETFSTPKFFSIQHHARGREEVTFIINNEVFVC